MQTPMQRSQEQMRKHQQWTHKNQQRVQQGIDNRRFKRHQSEMRDIQDSMDRMRKRSNENFRRMAEQRHSVTLQSRRSPINSTGWANYQPEYRMLEAETHPVRGFFVLMLTVAITIFAGFFAGNIFNSLFPAVLTWIAGVFATYHFTRSAWSAD